MTTMNQRLERVLHELAQKKAPEILHQPMPLGDPVAALADRLARYGHLAIILKPVAGYNTTNYDDIINQWAGAYVQFYTIFTHALFPSFQQVRVVYADFNQPPILILEGQLGAMIQAMGATIAPNITQRQQAGIHPNDTEILGVVTHFMDSIEASDLLHHQQSELRRQAIQLVSYIFKLPLQQVALTTLAPSLARQLKHQQPNFSPRPPDLPEQPLNQPRTDTDQLFTHDVPLMPFRPVKRDGDHPNDGDSRRMPPIPPPPRRK